MSERPLAILISGWGYVSAELDPLASLLSHRFEVAKFSGEDLLLRDVFVQKLNKLQRDQPGRKCLLVGWSLGAMLVLERLADLDSVDAVALVAGTSRFCIATTGNDAEPNSQSSRTPDSNQNSSGIPEANVRAMKIRCRRQPAPTLIDFYQQSAAPQSLDLATAEQMAAIRLAADSPGLGDGLDYLRRFDVENRISQIQTPVLILHGRQDQVINVAVAEKLGNQLPSATVNIHPEAGHDLPIRSSDWVAKSIIDFWSL